MGSELDFVDYVCDQAGLGSDLSYRKMFGEYALYLDGKVVALVCDNTLFVKPTDAGRKLLGTVSEAPPYPGSRPYFRIDDAMDDRGLLQRLFRATAQELPVPKPKRSKQPGAAARKRSGK